MKSDDAMNKDKQLICGCCTGGCQCADHSATNHRVFCPDHEPSQSRQSRDAGSASSYDDLLASISLVIGGPMVGFLNEAKKHPQSLELSQKIASMMLRSESPGIGMVAGLLAVASIYSLQYSSAAPGVQKIASDGLIIFLSRLLDHGPEALAQAERKDATIQ